MGLYWVVAPNGLNDGWTDGVPFIVIAKLFVLLSTKRFDWQVRMIVFASDIYGLVGTEIDLAMFEYLKFEM